MQKDSENLRIKLLGRWGEWATRHWGKSLLIALGVTVIMMLGVSLLEAEFTFYSIMPEGSSQVKDLKRIVENFPIASAILVVVEAEEKQDRELARQTVIEAVDALEKELGKPEYSEYVERVQGTVDLAFFRDHGLMVSDTEDIERFQSIYTDLNILPFLSNLSDDFEKEYADNEDNLADDEEMVTSRFEGLQSIMSLLARAAREETYSAEEVAQALDRFLFGQPYFLNRDNTMALLIVQPTFTLNDLTELMKGVPLIEKVAKETASTFGTRAGLTGLTVVGKDEGVTAEQGLALSMLIAMILILTLMILAFRMFSVPFISGIPLVVGIIWTCGVTGFFIRRLNIMTAMYMVALLGLGIDYAIHILTTFVQEREAGKDVVRAVGDALRKCGSGMLLGAVTTAVAFFMLVIARNEVIEELGLVAGFGIICELLAMLILIPALLGLRDHRLRSRGRSESFSFRRILPEGRLAASIGKALKGRPLFFALIALMVALVLGTQSWKVTIEDNLMEMEAEGLESVELQDLMVEEFGMAPDNLTVRTSDPEEMRSLSKKIEKLASVKRVESLAPYYPSREQEARRRVMIDEFRRKVTLTEVSERADIESLQEEVLRLEANLIEMSDLAYLAGLDKVVNRLNDLTGRNADGEKTRDTVIDELLEALEAEGMSARGLATFQGVFVPLLREKLLRMAATQSVSLDMIPPIIADSYLSKEGKDYLLAVVPTQNPWEGDFRQIYLQQVGTYTDKATGMLLAADQMTEMAETDGVRAAVASLFAIFLLLLLDFRNLKLSLLTLVPLLLSFVSLFGIMAVLGIKFDFVNIIAVPLLIGIGIDDAVHINHRYLYEGIGKMDTVVRKTGVAVLLTTVTTIIGFASFIPSVMRAMKSTGIVLSVAMALAFLYSLVFHTSVLVFFREKLNLNLSPWGSRVQSGGSK